MSATSKCCTSHLMVYSHNMGPGLGIGQGMALGSMVLIYARVYPYLFFGHNLPLQTDGVAISYLQP